MIDPRTTPIGYSRLFLGFTDNYLWQDKCIAHLENAGNPNKSRVNISIVTPNGSGKDDRIIPAAAYYWIGVHPRGTVVITSKSDLQLTQQTIPAIEKHRHKFDGYQSVNSPRYELTTPTGGRIIAFVTNASSRIEGWHREPNIQGPLLLILNEAKSIDEENFKAWDRCTPNAVMLLSSPGLMMGRFFDTHTKLKADWITVRAGLADCPHIPQDRIDYIIRTYGENHPITRSTLYGEFMEQDDADQFIVPLAILRNCLDNPPRHRSGLRLGFCDFGAGSAEHVLAIRDGNKVEIAAAWRSADKEASAGRFIREFRKNGLKEDQIWCDAADKEMADLLMDSGWTIHRQNFGAQASNNEVYLSWGAEAWHETAASIRKQEVILPDDDVLISQLTTRKKGITARGKLSIEEKYDMAKRNIVSPDRADAVCGALCVHDYSDAYKQPFRIPPEGIGSYIDSEDSTEFLTGAGAHAGL